MQDRDDQNMNQPGQQGQQFTDKDKQGFGQQGQQSTSQQGQSSTGQTGSAKGAFGEAGGDTTLTQGQKSQFDKEKDKERQGEPGREGFVGTSKEADTSEAYLSESETANSDFAEQGQGATQSRAGTEDIETGRSTQRDASLDDGS